jgi:hypothetical protein
MSPEMGDVFGRHIAFLQNATVRAVIIRGAGQHFSIGGHRDMLIGLGRPGRSEKEVRDFMLSFYGRWLPLLDLPVPVITVLPIHKTIPKILVHRICSTTHLGLSETLLEISSALADSAEIPLGTACCGTAGDRGLLHPKLVHSATRDTLVQIQSSAEDTFFVSANRTCELEEATRFV